MKLMEQKTAIPLLLIILLISALAVAQQPTGQQPIIRTNYIRLLYPNGGEVLKIGSTYRITWNASATLKTVGIRLVNTQYNLLYTVVTTTPNTGGYLWQVPSYVYPAPGYKIKIYHPSTPSLYDVSDSTFTIEKGSTPGPIPTWQPPEREVIKVISPRSGEKWYKERNYYIRWIAPREVKYVNLFVSFDDGKTYSRIDLKVRASKRKYRWKIPKHFYSSPNCRIKIVDYNNRYYFGTSGRFVILKRGEKLEPILTPPTPVPGQTTSPGTIGRPTPRQGKGITIYKKKVTTPTPTSTQTQKKIIFGTRKQ
ncbi:GPI anchored serine-threonine rich family protein [Candidatus Sumerlaeota bacterium]|nr:GPI anchored serine-threonine rich family protein [Candidatus Sumerlaeota bacterium]